MAYKRLIRLPIIPCGPPSTMASALLHSSLGLQGVTHGQ